ncbi:hypothetical protein GKS24_09510 [Streptococcus uberis]|uniref:hypothetical protein n=1 Tax=Streptococcus uberis TaxID=1349 RepID=UPI0012B61E11|nr:hypothetical protein [Streptococcus uberis]MTB78852.1 hypothetical protein [Streptococcus uberis]
MTGSDNSKERDLLAKIMKNETNFSETVVIIDGRYRKGEITADDALTELEKACKKYVIDRLLVSAEAAKLGILE